MAEERTPAEGQHSRGSGESLRPRFKKLAADTEELRNKAEQQKDHYWKLANIATPIVAVLAAISVFLATSGISPATQAIASGASAAAIVLVSRLGLREPARVWETRFAVFREVVEKAEDRESVLGSLTFEEAHASLDLLHEQVRAAQQETI